MIFIEIEELPKTEKRIVHEYKNCKEYFEQFMAMNTKVAWAVFEPHEYVNTLSACLTLKRSCRRFGYPIEVCVRNDDLYFVRTDM